MKQDLSLKRRLVLYSGGYDKGNERLDIALSRLRGRAARSLTYIPFSHENGEYYFKRVQKRYRKHGFKKFVYFAVDSDFLAKEMKQALKSDVIYLAGGNTYYFLKHLRESGFLKELVQFVKRGGILAGLSAGAIIMTPHIFLAGYPPHEGDENEVRLKNLKGLDLVGFEFYAHYGTSGKTTQALIKYSRRTQNPILACPDGSGIIVTGHELKLFGPCFLFYRGRRLRLA